MTTLLLRTEQNPLWLCFEPWGTEHTIAPNTAVLLEFYSPTPVELTHHTDGITFVSFGRHPDIRAENGDPVEIYSDTMPESPIELAEGFRMIMGIVPPRPSWGSDN
ncbi:hypothetical protein JOF56_005891 [Kibdelosporangium banguiense]|uniref:Uncharacterized protein n=1 Tax=Kibdelosporangium banguiense TaxID=1365924 RepID=A0ABS4TM88_9PSEU|nr:hypothetical protein [Kibdelosporangium banguiense]MBP2325506.1 hypothetical protein [Kibdelosporangium banguiense]